MSAGVSVHSEAVKYTEKLLDRFQKDLNIMAEVCWIVQLGVLMATGADTALGFGEVGLRLSQERLPYSSQVNICIG